MPSYLVDRKTKERYVVSGCIDDPKAPVCAFACGGSPEQKQLPKTVNLKSYMTRVKNQGGTNSCVGNAFSCAYEFLLKKYGYENPDMSRLFIYYNSRVKYRGPHNIEDSGTTLTATYQAVKEHGCCKGGIWPFQEGQIDQKPSAASYTNGLKYLATDGQYINIDLYSMKSCLAEGYPFMFGIRTFLSFGKAKYNGGIVPMPNSGERANAEHDGHAMIAVGYSDPQKLFIVKNSWGTDWGDHGYCYVPYDYLANPFYCQAAFSLREITKDDSENTKYSYEWWCNSCKRKANPATDYRYHCLQCTDFDLCEKCYREKKEPAPHRQSHKILCIKKQEASNVTSGEVLISPGDSIQGIHDTFMTRDSHLSKVNEQYPPNEKPSNVIDNNINTKYLNYSKQTGLNSGFYVKPKKGRSIVTGIQFTTANNFPERDPIQFTLEGSNANWSELNNGVNWTGICYAGTGLDQDPGRQKPGRLVNITNNRTFSSYRLLITSKRHESSKCVQYSGCTLFGKIPVSSPAMAMAACGGRNDTDDDVDDADKDNKHIGWNVDPEISELPMMAKRDADDDDDDWYVVVEND